MRYKLKPAIWSRDTCQRIAWFDRCQLIITRCHISKNDVIYRKYIVNQGCMSLSTYYLEDGRHVARLHRRRRRARPREIPLVAITWENQFMSFLYFPIWVWSSAWRLGLSRSCSATFEQLLAFGATLCGFSNLEQVLHFREIIFEQNIGLEHISSTKKSTISWKTSIHANFLKAYHVFNLLNT